MVDHINREWPYPGSCWWKFDLHTHTPASSDTYWARSNASLSEQDWLLQYMASETDCIAITDHNTGAWVDKLKTAYKKMKKQADDGMPPDGFRYLTLFPGVEISVHGGFHLLAILDPVSTTSDVDSLLGHVEYEGTRGNSDGVTRMGAADVVQAVLDAGGIPIPAHADGDKGLLRLQPETGKCSLDANTVRQVMETEGLLAVEWVDGTVLPPENVEKQTRRMTQVLGSDCHSFQGVAVPGGRYTWVKMANPTLEGLRLALLDGNDVSIRRSDDEGEFDPFMTPKHFITDIEIKAARFMGNGNPETLQLTPFYNALIGGRGTGKSTIVQALRLAYRCEEEIRGLSDDTELRRRFDRFTKVVRGREGEGALRENTEFCVILTREGITHRLRWRQDGQGAVVEERADDGQWQTSASSAINPERFPIRLLSQGQIAAMAGDNRQALVKIIDEAANVEEQHRAFSEAKRTYLSQRAKLRELEGKMNEQPELQRKLSEVMQKLKAFAQSNHAEALKAHQQALRQGREVDTTLEQLQKIPTQLNDLTQSLLLDDWPDGTFDAQRDADILAWRTAAERILNETLETLVMAASTLANKVENLNADPRFISWRQRAKKAQTDYQKLQESLAERGVKDTRVFGQLVQEQHKFDNELKELDRLRQDRDCLETESDTQWQRIVETRKAITRARAKFVAITLQSNAFVRMEVVGFGFDARSFERSLHNLLDVQDERFEKDILQIEDGAPIGGLAFELAGARDNDAALENIKRQMIEPDGDLDGRFRNYLKRKLDKPEFVDYVRCWFPDDDLRIEYSRAGDGSNWTPITQGSQGESSAALLAFLLAFGDEPLVLDQPEDDLDNHLIYDLIVRQVRENKQRRQLIIVTHNPNVVVNGDAEMVHAFAFSGGQCRVVKCGALQDGTVREEVCDIMEGGHEAFARRWARLGRQV